MDFQGSSSNNQESFGSGKESDNQNLELTQNESSIHNITKG